ncbi:MAG: cytochrome C oxidase subunit IV family protein [Chitinophagaceae bacterium]|jgi:cytochrome c oxidase subunit IV
MAHTADQHHDDGAAVKEIWKVTAFLTVLTIIELALGFWMMKLDSKSTIFAIKGVIVILMIWKAFYIVAYFMHLKHEFKSLIMTIVMPLLLFVWFIGAFLYEGDSYKNLRNTYDPYKKAQTEIKVEKKQHSSHGSEEKHESTEHKKAVE